MLNTYAPGNGRPSPGGWPSFLSAVRSGGTALSASDSSASPCAAACRRTHSNASNLQLGFQSGGGPAFSGRHDIRREHIVFRDRWVPGVTGQGTLSHPHHHTISALVLKTTRHCCWGKGCVRWSPSCMTNLSNPISALARFECEASTSSVLVIKQTVQSTGA